MSESELAILKQRIVDLTEDLSHSIIELTFQLTSTGVQPGKPPRPKRELEIVGRLTYGAFEINQGIKAWAYPQE